ncbi:hypothetical protein ACFWM5_31495 [Streptomyces bobili]|uniref:hypothetical protein n=1 Tax=Streptomyces bobili TaxID=67280 RepID=UPI003653E617
MDNDLVARRGFPAGTLGPSSYGGSARGGASYPGLFAAAGGDEKASGGQAEVERMPKDAEMVFAAGGGVTFAPFETGTVPGVSGASSSSATRDVHLASCEPAYEVTALCDRLFQQTA